MKYLFALAAILAVGVVFQILKEEKILTGFIFYALQGIAVVWMWLTITDSSEKK